jgi:hypothetical protein
MAGINVSFEVLNQLNTPTLYADTLVNRPTPAIVGRIFFRTDSPYGIYRDTGTAWDLVASPGGITGTLAAGQVAYATGSTTLAGTNNFFWDAVNSRLGIKTTTPGVELDVHGTGTVAHFNGTGTSNAFVNFQSAGVNEWRIGNNYSGGTNYFSIFDQSNSGEIVKIQSGTTASNGILTNTASVSNNYTEIGIAAATSVNGFATSNSYTFNAGITRTIGTVGNQIGSTFTYNGTYTQDVTGDWGNLNAGFTLVMNGNITNNQTGTYIKSPSSGRFGLTPSGTGTISHFATLNTLPDFGGNTLTVTNRYGVLINNFAGFTNNPTYTNRWGIYQDGSSDNNYFAGKIVVGTTTVSTYSLDVTGTFRVITGSSTGAAIFQNNAGTTQYVEIKSLTTQEAQLRLNSSTANYGWSLTQNSSNFYIGSQPDIGTSTKIITINRTNANVLIQNSTTSAFANASAQLQIDSTTKGFLPPRMTTIQKNAITTPAAGLVIFDTTLAKLCVYSGTAWETITSV